MTTATLHSTHYQVTLQNGRHEFAADEPRNIGGEDSGPSPDELFEASLASCTAITLRMYANRKQWEITEIEVTVTLERLIGKTIFSRSIIVKGNIDDQQRARLLEIAKMCPVSRTLNGEIEIDSSIT